MSRGESSSPAQRARGGSGAKKSRAVALAPLELRVLGEIELWRGPTQLALPQSKKTRALLAYLAVSERPQRRERLCDLLWDVADDPRAALRWSLSKLRPLVDEPAAPRLETSGTLVRFTPAGARVDLFAVREQIANLASLPTPDLLALASEFRGPFLEGLELPDFLEFQSWCLALREECRALHARVLRTVVERLAAEPETALPHARALAQLEPLDEDVHAALVRLLAAAGRQREAEQHAQSALRMLRQHDPAAGRRLEAALRARVSDRDARSDVARGAAASAREASLQPVTRHDAPPLVGRDRELAQLRAILDDAATCARLRAVLLLGEPGIGKTRLLTALEHATLERGGTVLEGRAYEAESRRPYGPWIDALRQLPTVAIGDTLAGELAPLLPELGDPGGERSRERLFGAVVELLAARAHSAPPVLVALDDVQWCDDASGELLHYVARMQRHRPVVLALAARTGELADNAALARVLRSLRHDGVLDDLELDALDEQATCELVAAMVPGADGARAHAASAGNPLFALELARSLPDRDGELPSSLRRLVRDRIEHLPADAADVLRWAAVLGHAFDADRLAQVAGLDPERLVEVLELLERFAMVRAQRARGPPGGYGFAHDVVRQVVYAELSEARRRLMHQRVVRALLRREQDDAAVAAELAHHASQAGDAETAARACLRAARDCLRVFAGAEADALARRGMHHAEQLREPARVETLLELAEVRYGARRPENPETVSAEIERLARHALGLGSTRHARLGFHLAAYLRWEGGNWSDAERQMLRAEEVSRATGGRERATALGEAARCLAMLEHDLGHAEALALEAESLCADLADAMPPAIPDAIGMLRLHEGRLDEAAARFAQAHALCRAEQDRLGEFRTLEHLFMVEMQRRRLDEARRLADELVDVAARLRDGSEAPYARVLAALVRYVTHADAAPELDDALAALRVADAKQRLTWALTRAAEADLARGDAETARTRGEEALRLALLLERPSDVVLARVVVARAAELAGDEDEARRQRAELTPSALRGVACEARAAASALGRASRRAVGRASRAQGRPAWTS